jgi:hypothetical protein
VTNPETVLKQYHEVGRSPSFAVQTNYAEIVEGSPPLRLSTPGWASFSLNSLRGVDSTELLFELSKEKIVTRIQPFAKRVRLFVERYLDFMKDRIAENFDQMPPDPLITPLDWIFSVWLPLPHAKVLVSPLAREKPAQIVEFDLVFWTGTELLCIQVEQKGTMFGSKRAALERFTAEQPQFKLIYVARDQLPDDRQKFPAEIFDENFLNFWSGIDLPKGPPLQKILNHELLT